MSRKLLYNHCLETYQSAATVLEKKASGKRRPKVQLLISAPKVTIWNLPNLPALSGLPRKMVLSMPLVSHSGFRNCNHPHGLQSLIVYMPSTGGNMGATHVQDFGQKYTPVLCPEYMPSFCLPFCKLSQGSTHNNKGARAPPVCPTPVRAPVVVVVVVVC